MAGERRKVRLGIGKSWKKRLGITVMTGHDEAAARTHVKEVQNGNGSWTGQHCITSPVFCTSAVILALTADRDAEILLAKK